MTHLQRVVNSDMGMLWVYFPDGLLLDAMKWSWGVLLTCLFL